MNNLKNWAEREIELACKKEKEGDDFDYGCACYESALKAYKSLLEDNHSGTSMNITKNILNRLIDDQPLTPIEDNDEDWELVTENKGEYTTYQSKRMSALFKDVYEDGTIKYKDVDRITCINIKHPNYCYMSSLVNELINTMYPIVMPYYPMRPIRVYCENFLVNPKNGDFDTIGVYYAILPSGKRKEINKYFKEGEHNYESISVKEYMKRKDMKINNKGD